jgi:hypothetical protein
MVRRTPCGLRYRARSSMTAERLLAALRVLPINRTS